MKKLVFDELTLKIVDATHAAWRIIRNIVLYFIGTLALAVVLYAVFALVFSTDVERRLRRENRMYEKIIPTLEPRDEMISDAITNLQYKDNALYEQVFHSGAPSVDPMSSLDFLFASDTIPDGQLVSYASQKADKLSERASEVDAAFEKIVRTVADPSFVMPPMSMPLKDITYPQVGASKGRKMSPFLKAYVYHSGLDFLVGRGVAVYAAADGVVGDDPSRLRSEGNFVIINHKGGYSTCYSHLDNVLVSKGQRVKCGQKIGTVGMSGNSFAPHLHYEVLRDGVQVDPVNYLFATVDPEDYANVLYMSVNTLQSMD